MNALGRPSENTRTHVRILFRALVAADDVVVEHGLDVPVLRARDVREAAAAVEVLFFAGDGQKDDGCREFQLAENSGALETNGYAAGVIIGAGRVVFGIEVVAVARVVMPGDQYHARCRSRFRALQDGVDIADDGGPRHGFVGLLSIRIDLDVEAAAALLRILLELRLDPVARRADAASGGDRRRVLRR